MKEKEYDAFISYAGEDKASFALPLAKKLRSIGLSIWFDDFCLKVGDSLREKIDYGLSNSNYGVVILSPYFFEKKWPQKELNALYSLEIDGRSAILPVWKDVTRRQVAEYSPLLADKCAAKAYEGIDKVAARLVEVIDPHNKYPELLVQEELLRARAELSQEMDVRVIATANMMVAGNIAMFHYDPSKTYISISVSNWGRRSVVIEKVGLHLKRKDKPFILATDSFYFGPRRLKDGERADYFIEQDSIQDLSLIDYVWAIDQVGREWRGEFKK